MTTLDGVRATRGNAEPIRARYPDAEGWVDRDGVRTFWERYGDGEPAVLFLPTWEIVHSRVWKCQIPYFSRHCCVVTFDPRGNGRSDRPRDVGAYDRRRFADDAIAVLDVAGVERAAVVSWCAASEDLILAAEHPERVTKLVAIAPDLHLTKDPEHQAGFPFDEVLDTDEGWAKSNRHYWLRDWAATSSSSSRGHTPSRTQPSAGAFRQTRIGPLRLASCRRDVMRTLRRSLKTA